MHGLCGWYIPAISIFELDQRMTAVRNSDVIIICGAMMGSAVAWFLASDPAFAGHITVVERDPSLEFASTSHSNSCMRQQFSTEINIRISQFTAAYIRDFKTHMGGSGTVPPRTDYFGYLYLAASDYGARAMRAMHDLQRRLGAATALLEPADLAREFPFMRLDDIRLGSLGLEDEGYFDAEAIRAAWVRGARALGARFITVEVVGFEQDGSGISAVVLGDGAAMDCGYVVNAAGPRAAQVAAMAGMALPVEPRKRAQTRANARANVHSYHRAECLTHVGDSQAVRSLTQCGEPMRFAMAAPIDLRNDFDSVSLRRLAKRTRDATQSRRLLALAEVYDGGSRTDASRIGGVGLQIIRDWVLRFNARGPDGLVDGKSPGAPSKLNADHRRALAEVVEAGPVLAVDGVVRWQRKDLARWLLETFAISLDETTVGRELKALGFAKISARPRHYAQNELAVEAFKKNFPAELAKIRARLPKGVEIELWWQDEARIGQKNKLTRRWARRGTRPRAPRDQRTEWAYIFGAICPAKGKGAGLVMPWCDTDAMAAHLIEISAAVDPGAHAVLIVDQAGWHLTPKLAIPDNITVLALPPRSPELNPVENVWQFMRDNWLSNRIFKSYEDIVALCCQAWNNLIDQPWKIMSLGMRKWAHGF